MLPSQPLFPFVFASVAKSSPSSQRGQGFSGESRAAGCATDALFAPFRHASDSVFSKGLRRDEGLFAAIDLGTQACLLLIGRLRNGVVENVRQSMAITRAGMDLRGKWDISAKGEEKAWASGRITDLSLANVCDILQGFKEEIRAHGATLVAAGATAAYRQSSNCQEAMRRFSDVLHFPCRALSGLEESEITHLGVANLYPDPNLAVFDMGGGSTELSWEDQRLSLPMGAMNFMHPLAEDPDKAFTHAVRLFRKAFESKPLKTEWPVLVGGTALALAHLESGMKVYEPECVEGCRLTADGLRDWVRLMRNLSRAELESLPGLDPGRSEILVSGLVLTMALAAASEVKGFVLSGRGLRYGLLLEGARRMGASALTDANTEKVL